MTLKQLLSFIFVLSLVGDAMATHCKARSGLQFSACNNNPINLYEEWISCNCEGQTVNCHGAQNDFTICDGQSYVYPNQVVYNCFIVC
ncbi:hypothetical protein BCR42DRAFT_427958 [Absidia repens]|uniref:Secreted protein n=1 Tax=Absidia repens TaxID=90262 RepID=A0A1X2HYW2_9FUNG|nr:hypothetical protein BCR42DRAFT_427958 [Absidia repens]